MDIVDTSDPIMKDRQQPATIVNSLERHARNQPDKPAIIFVDESLNRLVLTRQQLWEYCGKYAAILKRMDLDKGSVVCNTLRNSPQRLITELGTINAGAISMNGQTCRTDGSDIINSLKLGEANAIIIDREDPKGIFSILKPKLQHYDEKTGLVSYPDVPTLKYILDYSLKGKKNFLEVLDNEHDQVHANIAANDVCQYLCTSGSTSFFKLVAYSSTTLLEYGKRFAEVLDVVEDDVFMNNRSLGWLGGYPVMYLKTGATRVLLDASNGIPNNFSETQWKMAVQEKCTATYIPSFSLTEFKNVRESSEDIAMRTYTLRTVGSGGGPVSRGQVEAALGNIAHNVVIAYASTEAGFTTSVRLTTMAEFEEFKTGYPTSGTEVKVVDKNGKELPPGETGEIIIKSNQKALYYVKDPEKTSQTFGADGWVRLGDIGKLNSRNELFVVGRDKFAILRGSMVFYPDTIESYIRECPGVKDVVVTGVPDEIRHEQICALLIKQSGIDLSADDVLKYCEASINTLGLKELAPIPKYFQFVDSFPINTNGKLERAKAKTQACKLLGLSSGAL